jgi:hypothetical protein
VADGITKIFGITNQNATTSASTYSTDGENAVLAT